ncbi:MAG: hypothetical protein QNJ01_04765 [Desulfobacterales bacterium]|nr:hypothetical protein [Desulfobacterales bacterium]
MKIKSLCLCLSLLVILFATACSQGPTDEDVEATLDVITQILDTLPNGLHEGIAAGLQDSNVVEFNFNNEDFTIVQDGRLDLNREDGLLDMEMLWTLEDFVEPGSGHTVNGTIELTASGNIFEKSDLPENMALELDLNFSEGVVSTVAFVLDEEAMAAESIPTITVNGEPYQFKDQSIAAMLNKGITGLSIL